jgi:hypothetical protein
MSLNDELALRVSRLEEQLAKSRGSDPTAAALAPIRDVSEFALLSPGCVLLIIFLLVFECVTLALC